MDEEAAKVSSAAIERAIRDQKRWSGIPGFVFKFRILIAFAVVVVQLVIFWADNKVFSEAMPKVAGALALWSTLAGFTLGWIGDSSKVLLSVKGPDGKYDDRMRPYMEKLHDQIVQILRLWAWCAVLSAFTLVVTYVFQSVLPNMANVNGRWCAAMVVSLCLAWLVASQIRFYKQMESILRQRFTIEDFSTNL